jgi:hypothetical protein
MSSLKVDDGSAVFSSRSYPKSQLVLPFIVNIVGYSVAAFAASRLSLLFTVSGAISIWITNGIHIGAVVRSPPICRPFLHLGQLLAIFLAFTAIYSNITAASIAAIHVSESIIISYGLIAISRGRLFALELQSHVILALIAAAVAGLFAYIRQLAFQSLGVSQTTSLNTDQLILQDWSSDYFGIMVLVPLILSAGIEQLKLQLSKLGRRQTAAFTGYAGLITILVALPFGLFRWFGTPSSLVMFYINVAACLLSGGILGQQALSVSSLVGIIANIGANYVEPQWPGWPDGDFSNSVVKLLHLQTILHIVGIEYVRCLNERDDAIWEAAFAMSESAKSREKVSQDSVMKPPSIFSQNETVDTQKWKYLLSLVNIARTPLISIMQVCEIERLSQDTKPFQPPSRDVIFGIQKHVVQLFSLMDDVMTHSMLESNSIQMKPVVVNLVKLLESAFAELQSIFLSAEVYFEGKVAEDIPEWVLADPFRIKQVIINLVRGSYQVRFQMVMLLLVYGTNNKFSRPLRLAVQSRSL